MEQNYVDIIYENVMIQEGKQVIEKILVDIYLHNGNTSKDYAKMNGLPIPLFTAIKKEAAKLGLIERTNGIYLSQAGRTFVEQQFGYGGLNLQLYKALNQSDTAYFTQLLEKHLTNIFDNRPEADVSVDQAKCTMETAVKRAQLCMDSGYLIGKNILCLGDDDLISVALGMLLLELYDGNLENCKTRIYVVDLDLRILDYIGQTASQYNLPITSFDLDLRKTFPNGLCGKMDCVFTDPPYTLTGLALFLSSSIISLKHQAALPIFLSYAHRSPEEILKMHFIFTETGVAVMEIIPNFNEYEGAGILGNIGQMILLRTTKSSLPRLDNEKASTPIYTSEVRKKRDIRS